jgi:TolA-binding protein
MTPSDHTESRRLNALTELVRDSVQQPNAVELQHALTKLRTRTHVWPRIAWQRPVVAAVLVCCLAMAVVGVWFLSEQSTLPKRAVAVDRIEGGQILDGGYLSELGNAGIKLVFNEGSRFELSPGTRGRLSTLTTAGARLAIEHGQAYFRITENRGHLWSVEAGPFVVTVRGTYFAVEWDPKDEELEVSLRRGRVAVSGPVVGDELVLRPGQTLIVSLPRRESVIKEGGFRGESKRASGMPLQPAGSASADSQIPVSPRTGMSGAQRLPSLPAPEASADSAPRSDPSWREAIATGQWDRILVDIDRDGLASLRSLSSENLLAVADAARYRRRPDLARAALLEHRRRFPNSPRSLDALFLLGRVEEIGQGGKLAIRRYDEYLARAPAGTYAAEALGRRMILTKDVEGSANAARIAEQYLRRFPNGSYAKAARALQEAR